jgi:hypothetical protein
MLIFKRFIACALVFGAFATPYLAGPLITSYSADALSLVAVVAFTCLGLAAMLWWPWDSAPSVARAPMRGLGQTRPPAA